MRTNKKFVYLVDKAIYLLGLRNNMGHGAFRFADVGKEEVFCLFIISGICLARRCNYGCWVSDNLSVAYSTYPTYDYNKIKHSSKNKKYINFIEYWNEYYYSDDVQNLIRCIHKIEEYKR